VPLFLFIYKCVYSTKEDEGESNKQILSTLIYINNKHDREGGGGGGEGKRQQRNHHYYSTPAPPNTALIASPYMLGKDL